MVLEVLKILFYLGSITLSPCPFPYKNEYKFPSVSIDKPSGKNSEF